MTDGRVLRFLKEGTAVQHEAVERRIDLANRLRDPSTYSALLGRLYGFYAPLESALARVSGYESVGINFDERRKAGRLADDLAVLGHEPDSFPVCPDALEPAVLGGALGCMYVLEGATLGGRFISKAVEARLGFTSDRGCAFFASYGARVGPMWDAFRAALVRYAAAPRDEEEVVTAAIRTFESFDRWLAPHGAAP